MRPGLLWGPGPVHEIGLGNHRARLTLNDLVQVGITNHVITTTVKARGVACNSSRFIRALVADGSDRWLRRAKRVDTLRLRTSGGAVFERNLSRPAGIGTPRPRRARKAIRIGALGACVATATVLAACSSSPSSSSSGQVKGTVIVFAATSLTEAFNKIGSQFEHAHPGTTVKFNYNGSSSLASSITQGAKADVFASAATSNMDTVVSAGDAVGQPKTFAKNEMEMMVAKGNPMNITAVSSLANPAVKVVLCASTVPCGVYAADVFSKAGVTVRPVSEETNVGGVVTKVTLGEADAGMVYVTDVKANESQATGVPIPANQNVIADYPMVEVKGAPNATAAKSFMDYVSSAAGQQVLTSFGFKSASS